MSNTIDYIDDYFTGALSESERREFEARCSRDEVFATDVAFYAMARQSIKDVLLDKKKERWNENTGEEVITMKPFTKRNAGRWISYIAAASVVFIIGIYFIFYQATPQRLAEKYISEQKLSQLMDGDRDSLQAGIAEYKSRQYSAAVTIFNNLRKQNADNSEAQEYAGYSYLKMKDYDKALECFRSLSAIEGLQINSGDMMQAVTLLKRNQPGDEQAAKTVLEKVVREDEEGSKEAKEILEAY